MLEREPRSSSVQLCSSRIARELEQYEQKIFPTLVRSVINKDVHTQDANFTVDWSTKKYEKYLARLRNITQVKQTVYMYREYICFSYVKFHVQ